ncbi:MAG: NAD(P)/FAD-dependent oxidoreductase [Bacilli bacterium]|jgi:glycerol-3-phosphate dehydrogenase|nr:NAD(P)/FAD-dependent oxidoreductase [Bacilli bacterium]HKM10838.1 NAD(P)/FAD-dependent oxidoreductase [Bacilli bacterium]
MYDIIIIGAGVIGALVARKLAAYELKVAILEKGNDVCSGSTMANSAIVHSGYDPVPGTLKAKFNVASNPRFEQICQELDVPFQRIGSLTVATEKEQLPQLEALTKRAQENGVPVRIISQEELRQIEPNITPSAIQALFAPTAGIVDPFLLTIHAVENAIDHGTELFLNEKVTQISKENGIYTLFTRKEHQYQAKVVINAAGVHSDDIARLVGDEYFTITPRKGEYFVLDHFKAGFVNHVIFPLPSKAGKGILITPTTAGNYLIGPSSQFVSEKERVTTDSITLNYVKENAQRLIPNIPFSQVIRTFSGLRATPIGEDFIIEESRQNPGFIHVAGIESPGLVASPAISDYVVDTLVMKRLPLIKRANYNPRIRPYTRLKNLSSEERDALIEKNPEYGQIICRCEQISAGEINEYLQRNCPPHSIKAVKKRTRAGFGKCQGGFCQIHVIHLLAKHYQIPVTKVNYDEEGSEVLIASSRGDQA